MRNTRWPIQSKYTVHILSVLVAFLLVASAAVAAVLVSYNANSTASLSLSSPPVVWSAGPDASGNDFVANYALGSNHTYFTVDLKPIPEGNVTWGNLTTLKHNLSGGASYSVTATGTSVAAYTKILEFRLDFYAYGTDAYVATLDLTSGSPTTGVMTLDDGDQVYAKAWLKLDSGTSASDLPSSVEIALALSV